MFQGEVWSFVGMSYLLGGLCVIALFIFLQVVCKVKIIRRTQSEIFFSATYQFVLCIAFQQKIAYFKLLYSSSISYAPLASGDTPYAGGSVVYKMT